MSHQKICVSLFLIALLSGCSITRSIYTKKEDPRPEAEIQVTVSPAKEYDKYTVELAGEPQQALLQDGPPSEAVVSIVETPIEPIVEAVEVVEPIVATPTPRKESSHPTMVFSEIESANVRIPANLNNPFGGSDEIVVALSDLQGDFCYPYPGKLISPFGRRGRSVHTGIDIKAIPSDTIRAAFSGVVRMSKYYSGYGNIVVIRHYNGLETVYAHQTKNLVTVNDVVKAGDPIGLAGRTGRATTEHLHFEFRVANQALDPQLLVDPENRMLRNGSLYIYKQSDRVVAYSKPRSEVTSVELADASAQTGVQGGALVDIQESSVTSSQTTTPKPTSSVEKKYHAIKKGETLSHLARMYSTSVSRICELNGIKPTKVLQLGEKIRVR